MSYANHHANPYAEALTRELAERLGDPDGVPLYRAIAQQYPEAVIRQMSARALAVPHERIRTSRGAFYLAHAPLWPAPTKSVEACVLPGPHGPLLCCQTAAMRYGDPLLPPGLCMQAASLHLSRLSDPLKVQSTQRLPPACSTQECVAAPRHTNASFVRPGHAPESRLADPCFVTPSGATTLAYPLIPNRRAGRGGA